MVALVDIVDIKLSRECYIFTSNQSLAEHSLYIVVLLKIPADGSITKEIETVCTAIAQCKSRRVGLAYLLRWSERLQSDSTIFFRFTFNVRTCPTAYKLSILFRQTLNCIAVSNSKQNCTEIVSSGFNVHGWLYTTEIRAASVLAL